MSKFLQNLEIGVQETKYDVFICFWLVGMKFLDFFNFFFLPKINNGILHCLNSQIELYELKIIESDLGVWYY